MVFVIPKKCKDCCLDEKHQHEDEEQDLDVTTEELARAQHIANDLEYKKYELNSFPFIVHS